MRGSAGLTGAGESELASSAGRGLRAREGAGPAEREGRRARAGLSANGPSADRAKEKGGERGNWAGVGLIWFFSFPSPSLFPILNQLNIFEFKIEFEFKPHSNK